WDEQEFLDQAKDFKLVYLFSKSPVPYMDLRIRLTDIKVTFSKVISQISEMPEDISHYKGELSEKLLELAFDSGVYSRFKLDSRLTESEFQKLYAIWIKNAWESNAILEVSGLKGMVSYSTSESGASIGLIA